MVTWCIGRGAGTGVRYPDRVDEPNHLVLGADVGGTSARFAIVSAAAEVWAPVHLEVVPTGLVDRFEDALASVSHAQFGALEAACIALAGPVRGGHARLTNLPWHVDAATVARQLSLPGDRVHLINDVEAIAWAVPTLSENDVHTLHPGQLGGGNLALLAVGTGLGEAGLIWDGYAYHPFAGEGGHADFAPRDEVEWGFAHELLTRWGHASWERILSGRGLVDLYRYLVRHRKAVIPPFLAERMRVDDPAAAVAEAGLARSCELAVEAIQRFAWLLGAEGGNLALKLLARGGVYVGGGIPPKLLPRLDDSSFLAGFLAKGRMRPLLETFPVQLILDEAAGLRGAAVVASRLAARGEGAGGRHRP